MPPGGDAVWVQTEDAVRIRAGIWPGKTASTVLLFPGRTEYIEKYGHIIAHLQARGHGVVVIDWRGQGLSDRLGKDRLQGHVGSYSEYQTDLRAVLAHPAVTQLPAPRILLAHSMGGCIGLRALINGLDVEQVVFSAPMWGLTMTPRARIFSNLLTWLAARFGRGKAYTPGTETRAYVLTAPFEDNVLTADRPMWDRLKAHLNAQPDLALGGPSLAWLGASLAEMASLARAKQPQIPILTLLGKDEAVVLPAAIRMLSRRQPHARLEEFSNGRHEMLMEGPETLAPILTMIDEFLDEGATEFQPGT